MKATATLITALVLAGVPGTARADGPMRGPLPAEQRNLIHEMAARHESITRTVELTETGYAARTVSSDPEIAAHLQEHIAYMQARMDSGAMVRRWDPAFEEMFRHHSDISVYVMKVQGGVEARVDGGTPEAVLVVQNHAAIITDFVSVGAEAVAATHPAVVGAGESAENAPESGSGGSGDGESGG